MPFTNAENCRNYRIRKKKEAPPKIKTAKTNAERCRMFRMRKKLAQESKFSTNEILNTPSTSNSQMTFESSPQPVISDIQNYMDLTESDDAEISLNEEEINSPDKFSSKQPSKKESIYARLPKKAVDILTKWFKDNKDNSYPTQEVKSSLAQLTNLTESQVYSWIWNTRKKAGLGKKTIEIPVNKAFIDSNERIMNKRKIKNSNNQLENQESENNTSTNDCEDEDIVEIQPNKVTKIVPPTIDIDDEPSLSIVENSPKIYYQTLKIQTRSKKEIVIRITVPQTNEPVMPKDLLLIMGKTMKYVSLYRPGVTKPGAKKPATSKD